MNQSANWDPIIQFLMPVADAMLMIGKAFHDRALLNLSASALVEHPLQLVFE